jgi:hypothetical protein
VALLSTAGIARNDDRRAAPEAAVADPQALHGSDPGLSTRGPRSGERRLQLTRGPVRGRRRATAPPVRRRSDQG